jgi:hypothetical protein
MSGKIDGVPRELLEVIANSSERTMAEINAAIQQAREILAAPVVERQPVAWMYLERSEDGYEYRPLFSQTKWLVLPDGFYEEIPLYTSPPAPVSVVLPKRIEPPSDYAYRKGWNACLDKVKELNQ